MSLHKVALKSQPRLAIFAVGAAVLCITLAAGCSGGSGTASQTSGKHLGNIVVAVGIDGTFGSVVADVQKGFFAKNGIDSSIKVMAGGPDTIQAVSTGTADVTVTGQYSGPVAAAQGANTRIIAQLESAPQQFGIVATGNIQSPQDLNGKTIAFQDGSTCVYYWSLYKQHYHLTNVHVKSVSTAQLVAALAKHQADAYCAWQPYLSRGATSVAGAHILNYSGDDGVMLGRFYMNVSKKVYSNPALARAVLKSTKEASLWCNSHKAQLASMLANQYKAPLASMKSNVALFTYSVILDQPALDELNRVADFASRTQSLKRPSLKDYVNGSFLKAVGPSTS